MANYDDFKKKAKDAFETVADVSVGAYRIAEEKARILAKKARLNAEIAREKALIRRHKNSIGNNYYELHKNDSEEAFTEDCDAITDALIRIDAKRKEIEELKQGGSAGECDEESCKIPQEKEDNAEN